MNYKFYWKLVPLKLENTVNVFLPQKKYVPSSRTQNASVYNHRPQQWGFPTFNLKKCRTNCVPYWLKLGHSIVFFITRRIAILRAMSNQFPGTSSKEVREKTQQQTIPSAFSSVTAFNKKSSFICLFKTDFILHSISSLLHGLNLYQDNSRHILRVEPWTK